MGRHAGSPQGDGTCSSTELISAFTQQTGKAARERGARAFLISDTRSPDPRSWSAGTVRVPAEGPTFFPSLVPCLSVGQALIAELAALDPDRAAAAIADANAYWRRFGLVHWEE